MDYEKVYTNLYQNHNYMDRTGREELYEYCLDALKVTQPKTVVDLGCGRGMFLDWVTSHGWNEYAVGVDVSCVQIPDERDWEYVQANCWNVPFPPGSFYWATSFDVLEHLHPYEVRATLREAKRLSRYGMIGMVFAAEDLYSDPISGANLHRTVRSKLDWYDELAQYGSVEQIPGPGPRTPFVLRWSGAECK